MPEAPSWPDWLAGASTDPERLSRILAAVARCYEECPLADGAVPSGPHVSVSMAGALVGQMLQAAREDEREKADAMRLGGMEIDVSVYRATEALVIAESPAASRRALRDLYRAGAAAGFSIARKDDTQ